MHESYVNGFWDEMMAFCRRLFNSTFKTVQATLTQIEAKQYEESLIAKGIPKENIRKYGFVFKGKYVLIGSSGVTVHTYAKKWCR